MKFSLLLGINTSILELYLSPFRVLSGQLYTEISGHASDMLLAMFSVCSYVLSVLICISGK